MRIQNAAPWVFAALAAIAGVHAVHWTLSPLGTPFDALVISTLWIVTIGWAAGAVMFHKMARRNGGDAA